MNKFNNANIQCLLESICLGNVIIVKWLIVWFIIKLPRLNDDRDRDRRPLGPGCVSSEMNMKKKLIRCLFLNEILNSIFF